MIIYTFIVNSGQCRETSEVNNLFLHSESILTCVRCLFLPQRSSVFRVVPMLAAVTTSTSSLSSSVAGLLLSRTQFKSIACRKGKLLSHLRLFSSVSHVGSPNRGGHSSAKTAKAPCTCQGNHILFKHTHLVNVSFPQQHGLQLIQEVQQSVLDFLGIMIPILPLHFILKGKKKALKMTQLLRNTYTLQNDKWQT